MTTAFSGLGPTIGTYAERLAIASPQIGQLFYQTDTDEYVKYVTYGGINQWMQATLKPSRNLIINGAGTVAQRNTGSVALTTSVAYGSIDRWAAYQLTSAAGTISRITTSLPTATPNNIVFSSGFRIGRNSAATNTGLIGVSQALETVNSLGAAGKRITLSFWAKAGANYSASANGLFATLQSGTGTDQAPTSGGGWTGNAFVVNTTFTLTSSWAFYSITGIVASNATQLGLILSYAPVGTAGADDNVYITGVQLESGTAPSEFEFEDAGTTFRKCQRYYYRNTTKGNYGHICTGMANTTSSGVLTLPLPTEMRAKPTSVEFANLRLWASAGGAPSVSTVVLDWEGPTVCGLFATASAAVYANGAVLLMQGNNTIGAYLALSAEL